jgi:ribosomal protein S8
LKNDLKLLNLLTKLNITKSYNKVNKNLYVINLSYRNNKHLFKIKTYFRKSNLLYVSNKILKKNQFTENSFYIISNDKGFFTNTQANKNNIGGLIIAKIYLNN